MSSVERFWTEDFKSLIESFYIFPAAWMTRDQQLNALTRLAIIIFVIMLLAGFRYAWQFLVIVLVVIIWMRYSQSQSIVEGYEPTPTPIVPAMNIKPSRR